MNNFRQ